MVNHLGRIRLGPASVPPRSRLGLASVQPWSRLGPTSVPLRSRLDHELERLGLGLLGLAHNPGVLCTAVCSRNLDNN